MQFFKKSIDPLYVILGFGFMLCIVMCIVSMIQIGSLQEQMETIANAVNTLEASQPVISKSDDRDNLDTGDEMLLKAANISISAEAITIQANNEVVIENQTESQILYYDQGLFVPSGLSADQFNEVIENALAHYNRSPDGYLAYNSGATLVEIERTYGINGLYLIGITQRESGFNTSDNAKATNNLTSIMNGPSLKRYASVEENLMDTARLLRNVYYNKRGLTNIYDVGAVYNPVNNTWAPKVQESVNLFYSLINTPNL